MLRSAALALALSAVLSAPAAAQADSLADPAAAGRAAADERGRAGYFLSSFVGGVAFGFFLPIAAISPDAELIAVAGAGAGVMVASTTLAGRSTLELPPTLEAELQARSPEYRESFRMAYSEGLRRRRERASFWGAGIGTGTGVAALAGLVWFMTQVVNF